LEINRSKNGKALLHLYRSGKIYSEQKNHIFLKEWTNIVFSPLPFVNRGNLNYHNVTQPLLFDDNIFDAVNAYHILEHLTPEEGDFFISELYRVLKPGCVCRLSTPDLEGIVKDYLDSLKCVDDHPSEENMIKYHWGVCELIDQATRSQSGGEMFKLLQQGKFDPAHIRGKFGDVFNDFFSENGPVPRNCVKQDKSKHSCHLERKAIKDYLLFPLSKLRASFYKIFRRYMMFIHRSDPRFTREAVRWNYDRFSLMRILKKHGFTGVNQKDHKNSDIPDWHVYNLDCSNFGDYPLDRGIYVEGRKPDVLR